MLDLGAGSIRFFRSLANSAGSGVGLQRAAEILRKGGSFPGRAALDEILRQLEQGRPLSEALRKQPEHFAPWQVEIVRIGEATGRLDSAFLSIAEVLEERRGFLLSLLSGFAYPLFILHLAPFMIYGGMVFAEGWIRYLISVAGFLACFYAPAALAAFAWKRVKWSVAKLPVISSFAKAQFCQYLSAMIKAAVPIRRALELAAEASGIEAPATEPRYGESVVEHLARYGIFSAEDLARVEVAEASGKVDEDLGRLAGQSRERWTAALKTISTLLPPLVYLVIGLAVAYRILSFYNGYFSAIDQAMH